MNKSTLINIGLGTGVAAVFGAMTFVIAMPMPTVPLAADTAKATQAQSAPAQCGNAIVEPGETCDDANGFIGDGCTVCQVEPGYACAGQPSVCQKADALTCGNGMADAGEQCDDGNIGSNDGCDVLCAVEEGFTCEGLPSVCKEGSSSSGSSDSSISSASSSSSASSVSSSSISSTSSASSASSTSSVILSGVEGSSASSASSSSDSSASSASSGSSGSHARFRPRDRDKIPTYSGEAAAGKAASTSSIFVGCGDALVWGTEACDDGNTKEGDGCSKTCTMESGWACYGNPSQCSMVCGDGVTTAPETCDDKNTRDGDGCSSACRDELGWSCKGSPSTCTLLTPQ